MRMTVIAAACLLFSTVAYANPNTAPDVSGAITAALGGLRTASVEIRDEDLNRDGLEADYFATFRAEVVVEQDRFAPVEEGDGYVIVQRIVTAGTSVPATGNVLGAYRDGAWQAVANLLDIQMPGGAPFQDFARADRVVLAAESQGLNDFLEGRAAVLEASAAMRRQEIALEDQNARLEHELALEREILQRERQAAAEAATRIAEMEAAERVRAAEAEAAAELLARQDATDAAIFALFTVGAVFPIEVTHEDRRVVGTLSITAAGVQDASGTIDLALGGGQSYQGAVVITAARETGEILLRRTAYSNFEGSSSECREQGRVSLDAAVVSLTYITDRNHCRGDGMAIRIAREG